MSTLRSLLDRLAYEVGGEHEDDEVLLMTRGAKLHEVLSLNWSDEHQCWLLIGDPVDGSAR